MIFHGQKLLLFLLILLLISCRPTRRLADGEVLFRKARVEFIGAEPYKLEDDLLELVRPRPNGRVLGMPVKLGIYNTFSKNEKGIGKWLRTRFGEPPVLYQPGEVERSRLLMEKFMRDEGYLQASVHYDSVTQNQKAVVIYRVSAENRYTVRDILWPQDSSPIHQFMWELREETVLQKKKPYRVELLEQERQRLAETGLDRGFFGLSQRNFYFHVDTSAGNQEVDLYPRAATEEGDRPLRKHFYGSTTVHATFLLDEKGQSRKDTLPYGTFRFIQSEDFVDPRVIRRAILQDRGDLFRNDLQQRSVNRLIGLGPYKFVNLKYQVREPSDSLLLDREFFLTPGLTQDFSAELEASTLSSTSNFLGSALHLTYNHRNILGGAERFRLDFSGGIETQLDRDASFIRNVNLSLESRISFPNILAPFQLFQADKSWQSRSVAQLAGDFQRRTGFFSLLSFRGEFGYEWQPGRLHRHKLYPVQLTQVRLVDASPEFRTTVDQNPRLQESFSDYFIAGATYQYNYSEQQAGAREDYLALQGIVEPAGNLAYGLSSLLKPGKTDPYELLGLPFAQFLRLEGDGRYHHYLEKSDWVVRGNLGVALPYGNAQTVPFVRQFFVGGSNSMRAWQIRTLGPGTSEAGIRDTTIYNDQTGDVKIELNAEYRFPIYRYLKGALFVDAGNIWLVNDRSGNEEESIFRWNRFYREMAVGAGMGFRLDITYFVLRLDVAFPIRKPYLEEGPDWVLDRIRLGDPGWRKDNLTFNLALGYPF